MKKYICLILAAVLLLSGILSISAADDQLFIPLSDMDSELTAIVNTQLGEEERALLNNKEKFDDDVKNISLEGKRIVKIYHSLYRHLSPISLKDLIIQGESE